MPCALSLRPALRASFTPLSVRSTSFQPVNKLVRFHSLSPWRTSTSRRSVIGRSLGITHLYCVTCIVSDVLQPEHVGHRVEPRLLAARPQRRLECAAREDHAV